MTDAPRALFAGLCTLDVIQLVDRVPGPDEKLTAHRQTVAAGGPAANAAATFAHLGGAATLLTALGRHPLAAGARADLAGLGVRVVDLAAGDRAAGDRAAEDRAAEDRAAEDPAPPAVSSIMVTAGAGHRAVVSTNAAGVDLPPPPGLDDVVRDAAAVLVDGHHPRLAHAALSAARALGRVTVLDAGSWKPGTGDLLPLLDVVVCSADFRPPGTRGPREVAAFLHGYGVRWVAVTRGSDPVLWWPDGPAVTGSPTGTAAGSAGGSAAGSAGGSAAGSAAGAPAAPPGREVPVPAVPVVDTLGAGDVFHGALVHALATGPRPGAAAIDAEVMRAALARAASVASRACASFGTRAWMTGETTADIAAPTT